MVRAAAKNHAERRRRHRPGGIPAVVEAALGAGGFTLAQRQRLAAEAFVHTATYDVHVASWMGNVRRRHVGRHRLPGVGRRDVDRAVGAALRREPAPAGRPVRQRVRPRRGWPRPSSCRARRCRTTTTSTPTPPCARRTTTATGRRVAIVKHTNPCGIAVGTDVERGLPQGARVRPGVGLRRGDRHQPAGHGRHGRQAAKDVFTEVIAAPDFEPEALALLAAQAQPAAAAVCRPPARGGAEIRPVTGGLLMQVRDTIDAVRRGRPAGRRRPVPLAAGVRRAGRRGDAGRPRSSPGGPSGR